MRMGKRRDRGLGYAPVFLRSSLMALLLGDCWLPDCEDWPPDWVPLKRRCTTWGQLNFRLDSRCERQGESG